MWREGCHLHFSLTKGIPEPKHNVRFDDDMEAGGVKIGPKYGSILGVPSKKDKL